MPEYFIEKDLMNEVFSSVFGHESEEKQAKLKSKAASLDTFLMAKRRVEEIAKHIIKHFKEKIYPNNYKAMLVCHNRYQAIAYQKAFLKLKEQGLNSFESKVIMSFDNKKDPIEFRELAVPRR